MSTSPAAAIIGAHLFRQLWYQELVDKLQRSETRDVLWVLVTQLSGDLKDRLRKRKRRVVFRTAFDGVGHFTKLNPSSRVYPKQAIFQ